MFPSFSNGNTAYPHLEEKERKNVLNKKFIPPLAMLYILLHTSVESWIQMVSAPITFSLLCQKKHFHYLSTIQQILLIMQTAD